MKVIEFTIQEIWAATRNNIHKNAKVYNRKLKHKNKDKFDYEKK